MLFSVPLAHKSKLFTMSIGLPESLKKINIENNRKSADNLQEYFEEDGNSEGVVVACITFLGSEELFPDAVVLPIPCKQQKVNYC